MNAALTGLDTVDHRWHHFGREAIMLHSPVLVLSDRQVSIPTLCDGLSCMGFVTDGGTIPQLFTNIISPWGRFFPAFVWHDYAWSMRGTMKMSYDDSNDMLYHLCCYLDQLSNPSRCPIKPFTIWRCVQSFGRSIWNKGTAHADNVEYHYAKIVKT